MAMMMMGSPGGYFSQIIVTRCLRGSLSGNDKLAMLHRTVRSNPSYSYCTLALKSSTQCPDYRSNGYNHCVRNHNVGCHQSRRSIISRYPLFQSIYSSRQILLSSSSQQTPYSTVSEIQLQEISEAERLNEVTRSCNNAGDKTCLTVDAKCNVNNKVCDINKNRIEYPLRGRGQSESVFTEKYNSSKVFLESLNVPTDELEFYPDIQSMEKDDVLACIERLKEYRIHVIFSLFLLQRVFIEINLERTTVREPMAHSKHWYKLRNGMYKLTSMRYIILYLELSKLLDKHDLDPVSFMEELAEVGVYDHLQTILNKTKKLMSVGAKPTDILDNLTLYSGSSLFKSKIKLYQNLLGENGNKTFPLQLFLSTSMAEFKRKLPLGNEVGEIAKLLNIKEEDFLMCWGFKSINTRSMVYKVQMCLRAGISPSDVLNNIGILDRLSMEQCHRVTKSLCQSGQPGSVYVFKALESNIQHRSNEPGESNDTDWTRLEPGDHSSEGRTHTYTDCFTAKLSRKPKGSRRAANQSSPINKSIQSSKLWRMEVFKLIGHLLSLDRPTRWAMYKTDINIDPTQLIDVTKNLDFLLSQNFTKDDIRHCPIVLAHPYENVVRVKRDLEKLIKESASSSYVIRTSPLSLLSSSPSLSSSSSSISPPDVNSSDNTNNNNNNNNVCSDDSGNDNPSTANNDDVGSFQFLSDPVFHLNVLQYYLEKETNFSLNYTHTQSVVEFLN